MFGQVRTASLPGQLIQWMHTSLIFAVKYGATLETVYKVAICHRVNLLYKQIYFTKDLQSLKNGVLGIKMPTL